MRVPRIRIGLSALCLLPMLAAPRLAHAVASGEFYSGTQYGYGRFEARIRFAGGDGVVSSFFLWKDGSEVSGTFWNELDFEKVGADCHVETNAIFGNPPGNHSQRHTDPSDACDGYHVYAYEWTPDAIVWLVDGVEIRRETGATAAAFAENAPGMQFRFNVWPGDASFGGNFSPDILPVHQYVDWVQYSAYEGGQFTLKWREDFDGGALPSGWLTGNWPSPKNKSTHHPGNVNVIDGHLVISLTADDAVGPAGAMPGDGGSGGEPATGEGGSAGSPASGGAPSANGGSDSTGGMTANGGSDSGGAPSANGGSDSGQGASASGGSDPAPGASGGSDPAPGASGGSDPGSSAPSGGSTSGSTANPGATTGGTVGASGAGPSASSGGASSVGGNTSGQAASPPADSGGCSLTRTGAGHSGIALGMLGLGLLLGARRRFTRGRRTRSGAGEAS